MVRYSISPTLVTAWEANGALGLGFNIFLSKGFGLFFEYRWGLYLSGKDDFKPTVGWETDLRKGNKGFSSLRTGILIKL